MKLRHHRHLRPFSAASLIAGLALLAGCGGGGGGGETPSPNPTPSVSGKLRVEVAWPATVPGRVIPTNALSVRLELLKDGATIRTILLAKPDTQADFVELPLGALNVRATAFPNADGSGTALATATVGATISADAPVSVPITMASTVTQFTISPTTLNLALGGTSTASVTAKNAAGTTVLIDPSAITYVSSAPALVKVTKNANGSATITHLAGTGSATITATESGSGRTATIAVTVVGSISVSPATATISVGGHATFTATVLGPSNTAVTWSVTESGGGSVTSAGVYTAPATHGTYHVVATSVADPSRKATATVTVRSGSGSVIVH